MALTNSQYDTIMRGYDRRQYENYRRQCARTDEIYEKFPRIREIQEAMSACSIRQNDFLTKNRMLWTYSIRNCPPCGQKKNRS